MSPRTAIFAALSILCCGLSASAETLRCQSINGNLNCAGSGGVSCQTVNGKQVCISGHGDVVQSFGGQSSGDQSLGDQSSRQDARTGDEDIDDPALHQRLEQHDGFGHMLPLQRDGTKPHLRTSLDRN